MNTSKLSNWPYSQSLTIQVDLLAKMPQSKYINMVSFASTLWLSKTFPPSFVPYSQNHENNHHMNIQTKWLKLKCSNCKITNMNIMPLLKKLRKILHLLLGIFFPPCMLPYGSLQFIYFLAANSFEQKRQYHSKLKVKAQSMSFYKTLMQKSSLNQHQVESTSYALKISVRSTQLAGLMSHDRNLKFRGPKICLSPALLPHGRYLKFWKGLKINPCPI